MSRYIPVRDLAFTLTVAAALSYLIYDQVRPEAVNSVEPVATMPAVQPEIEQPVAAEKIEKEEVIEKEGTVAEPAIVQAPPKQEEPQQVAALPTVTPEVPVVETSATPIVEEQPELLQPEPLQPEPLQTEQVVADIPTTDAIDVAPVETHSVPDAQITPAQETPAVVLAENSALMSASERYQALQNLADDMEMLYLELSH